MSRFAVLTKSYLLTYKINRWEEIPVRLSGSMRISDVCEVGLQENLTHLWVMPDVVTPDATFAKYDSAAWESLTLNWTEDKKQLTTVNAKSLPDRRGRRNITVMFAANSRFSERAGWMSTATPKQLYITILYIEKAINEILQKSSLTPKELKPVSMTGSPGTLGWKVLESLHPDWIYEISGVNLYDCHFSEGCTDLIWQSPVLENREVITGYLHKFDRRMAFTAAASGPDSKYGVGTPEHLQGEVWFNPKKVGVWRCELEGEYDSELPEPWQGLEWIATPQVRLLKHLGIKVKVLEAWVFPESHTFLAAWASCMWDVVSSFDDEIKYPHPIARENAKKAMKLIANSLIGFTQYSAFSERDIEKRRPDIRTQTVSRNAELVYHNILNTLRMDHIKPLLVYNDAVYYLTDEPDGRKALPSMLKREGKLGGYKFEGTIHITQEINDALNREENSHPGAKLSVLNKKGWVK